jgi:hypothetical protein
MKMMKWLPQKMRMRMMVSLIPYPSMKATLSRDLHSLDEVEDYADYDSDFEPRADIGHHDVDPYAGVYII